MASWLKVAEDLLEVVDRRAKLVVTELSDEQSGSQASASNGQEDQAKKAKSKEKVKLQSSIIKTPKSLDQKSKKPSVPNVKPDKVNISQSDYSLDAGVNGIGETCVEPPSDDSKATARSDTENEKSGNDLANEVEVQMTENKLETRTSSDNDGPTFANLKDELESSSSFPLASKGIGTLNEDRPADAAPKVNAVNEDTSSTVIQERPEYETAERQSISNSLEIGREALPEPSPDGNKEQEGKTGVLPEPSPNGNMLQENRVDALPKPSPNRNKQQGDKTDALPESSHNGNKQQDNETNALLEPSHDQNKQQENKPDVMPEPSPKKNKQQERKADVSSMEVQDQLNEAQGLLKSAVKTGQSKEARLARVCAGLSSRLQEYKIENAQLEELLSAERELSGSYEARIKQLQQELCASKMEVAKVESNMTDSLATKNSEIEALTGSMDTLKKKSAAAEEKLALLQADMETIRRGRELTETRMIQALREELASVERRADEERAAHSATKMAAVEREIELEHRAVEASNALARIQRTADESTSRAMELEHKVALLEVECASLNQELQELEARNRRGQRKSSEEANQILQVQAWQDEVERARQGQREAENKLSSLEAELQKMRVEMAGMKRDAEHYSRQEHMELEKRYRELTDLLYHKQTQIEIMASEKAALEFQLEKEIKRLQEVQVEAERSRAVRRASSSWEEDTDLKALEPLPLHHRRMVGASMQLQRAAKFLDSGAVRATRFLWRYPYARVILLFYLVFVHLFLMYVLHRLQEQADSFASREVAVSMGLSNSSLP